MSEKENSKEVIELRQLGYGPTAIAKHLNMKTKVVSVMINDYAQNNKMSFPPIHKRSVSYESFLADDRVEFSFQEGKYQHLTGIIQKVNSSSYIVKLDEIHFRRVKFEKWWIEGNGNINVSKAKCKKVAL